VEKVVVVVVAEAVVALLSVQKDLLLPSNRQDPRGLRRLMAMEVEKRRLYHPGRYFRADPKAEALGIRFSVPVHMEVDTLVSLQEASRTEAFHFSSGP